MALAGPKQGAQVQEGFTAGVVVVGVGLSAAARALTCTVAHGGWWRSALQRLFPTLMCQSLRAETRSTDSTA